MRYWVLLILVMLLALIGCAGKDIAAACTHMNTHEMYSCILDTALARGDINTCNLLSSIKPLDRSIVRRCYSDYAIENLDPDLCPDTNHHTTEAQYCLNEIARKTKDPSVCYRIERYENDISSGSSRGRCLESLGTLKSDISLCIQSVSEGLIRPSSYCFSEIGKVKNSTLYCDMIPDVNLRMGCHMQLNPHRGLRYPKEAIESLNPDLCGDSPYRPQCISNIAYRLNDTNICYLINQSRSKASCIYKIVYESEDWAKCSQIDYPYLSNPCYYRLLRIPHRVSLQKCFETESPTERTECFMEQAKLTLNASYCHWISYNDASKECYIHIANLTNNPSVCENIGPYPDRLDCYRLFAFRERNAKFCDSIIEGDIREWCLAQTAVYVNDISLCKGLNNSRYRNQCIRWLAAKASGLDLCQAIDDSYEKDLCVAWYALSLGNGAHCLEIMPNKMGYLCHYSTAKLTNDWDSYIEIGDRMAAARSIKQIALEQQNQGLCMLIAGATSQEGTKGGLLSIQDSCLKELAAKKAAIGVCEDIDDLFMRNSCQYETRKERALAAEKRDWQLHSNAISNSSEHDCRLIKNKVIRASCLRAIAMDQKNALLCHQIPIAWERDMCLRDIGILNKDINMCKAINNKDDREMCLRETAAYLNDLSMCNMMSGINKDLCLWSIALTEQELNHCNAIENDNLKISCVISIAAKNSDESICELLRAEDKSNCLINYAYYHAENLLYCNRIHGDERRLCHSALTRKLNSSHTAGFCRINDEEYYGPCLSGLSERTHDYSMCSLIHDQETRNRCYKWLLDKGISDAPIKEACAINDSRLFSSIEECYSYVLFINSTKLNDVSVCERMPINNYGYRDSCYMNNAYQSRNHSLCKEIGFRPHRQDCFSSLCIKSNNVSLCDEIDDAYYRDWSKAIIAFNKADSAICSILENKGIEHLCKATILRFK